MNKFFGILLFGICIFASATFSQAYAESAMIGCDPAVLDKNKTIVDALNDVNAEIIKANIQQPTPVEMMSCVDQQLELLNASGGIHANPGGDISASLNPFAKVPLLNEVTNFLNGVSAQVNSITNAINSSFSNIVSSFTGGLAGLSGGSAPSTNCGVTEQTWLINQCIEMPTIPSLNDILGGKIAEISGVLATIADPSRLIEQVCSKANSSLQGYFSDLNSSLDKAANEAMNPLTDVIP